MRGKRVLLVEDEPLVRDVLVHNLIDEGYAVDAAATVAEASEYLPGSPPAIRSIASTS